ncbi:MAG: NAD-dependent epimerase/dehydratase family protein [Gemmataceae bacterium]|nr:NAD-dependent epimerase/dehydratase family protein [Gemmataceae bacterium]
MTDALVTGGAGFIGRHLVGQLVAAGQRVRVLDRASPEDLPAGVEFIAADIRDRDAVRRAAKCCRHVYHLAANPQLWTRRKGDFAAVNEFGTRHVLEAALEAGAERVLHCSTESILTLAGQQGPIGEDQRVPITEVIGPYCRSKWRAEQYAFALARRGAPVVIVNPTLPVGPGDVGRSPPTQMILDCALGRRAFYLDAELNLIDARDVAAGMIAAVERGRPGRRYLLGAENWSIQKLFMWVAWQTGAAAPRIAVPYPVALATAMVSEWIADVFTGRIPAASMTGVRLTRRKMEFDSSRSLAELGIAPRPVTESLIEAIGWFRQRKWL